MKLNEIPVDFILMPLVKRMNRELNRIEAEK